MKKRGLCLTVLLIFSIMLILSCTPAPISPAISPAISRSVQVSTPTPNLPPLTSQADTAWQKVIDAAKKEGKVNIYSFSMTGDIALVTVKAFQDRYGVGLDIISGRGATFLERIATEQRMGQATADIMEGVTTHGSNLKSAGNTVSSRDIPVLREKDVWRVDPLTIDSEGHLLVQRSMYQSPWINTNLIKPGQEPQSYRDLAKPQWKDKIVMPDPLVTTAPYLVFLSLVDRGYLDMEFVSSLKDQGLKYVAGTRDMVQSIARGEAPFGLAAGDIEGTAFAAEGAPIRAIVMEEGTVVSASAVVRVKNGPHPNAAKLFINWILGQEGQTVYSKAIGLASVRKDVPDFRHTAVAVVPKRIILITAEDDQRQAKAFRDKLLAELWKK